MDKPTIPIPNYFENPHDGQTPSNTPNNKNKLGGGGFKFDMGKMDFSSKFKSKYSDDEDDDNEIQEQNTIEYCMQLCIGTRNKGYCSTSESQINCSSLFCEKCNSKVKYLDGFKWKNVNKEINQMGLLKLNDNTIKENLEEDNGYCFYHCKCTIKSVNQSYLNLMNLGLQWECDGHKL